MGWRDPITYTFAESWRQPGSFAASFGADVADTKCPILYFDFKPKGGAGWNFYREHQSFSGVRRNPDKRDLMFADLCDEQKNILTAGMLFDDILIGDYAGDARPKNKLDPRIKPPAYSGWCAPQVLRTKMVLLPSRVVSNPYCDVGKCRGPIFNYTRCHVAPEYLNTPFLTEPNVDRLKEAIADGETTIYPVHFTAVRFNGLRPDKNKKMILKNNIAAYYMQNRDSVEKGEFAPPDDAWLLECRQPYSSLQIGLYGLEDVVGALQEFERQFVDRHYDCDEKAQKALKKTQSDYGVDPLHYSHVTPEVMAQYREKHAYIQPN